MTGEDELPPSRVNLCKRIFHSWKHDYCFQDKFDIISVFCLFLLILTEQGRRVSRHSLAILFHYEMRFLRVHKIDTKISNGNYRMCWLPKVFCLNHAIEIALYSYPVFFDLSRSIIDLQKQVFLLFIWLKQRLYMNSLVILADWIKWPDLIFCIRENPKISSFFSGIFAVSNNLSTHSCSFLLNSQAKKKISSTGIPKGINLASSLLG